jgi:GrpB-like predicted nucleotidyltransferase (UPF0157 family)
MLGLNPIAIDPLPAKSSKALEVVRLVNKGLLGLRFFRVYSFVAHYQKQSSDTYLHILSGNVEFAIKYGDVLKATVEERKALESMSFTIEFKES